MKLVCSILFACIFSLAASAQKVYFIYLQTENSQPFYVKLDDKIHSASTKGFLILPELSDSTYQLFVGLPPSGSEARFVLKISGRDHGYIIKNSDRGPSLLDLQSSNVIRPEKNESDKNISYQVRNDAFTLLLAKAAHDTSLLLVPVALKQDVAVIEKPVTPEVKKQEPVSDPVKDSVNLVKADPHKKEVINVSDPLPPDQKPVNNRDSVVHTEIEIPEVKKVLDETPSTTSEIYKRSVVKKQSESSTSEGFGLVFQDVYLGGADTIRLLIPNPKIIFRQPDTSVARLPVESNSESEVKTKKSPVQSKPDPEKTDCTAVATDNDFFKLRKVMASKMTDESMLTEARKYFRLKCYSTQQIRNLSTLFLTGSGKFDFFSAAYLKVTDPAQFASLQSEIKDEYYLKRFKALVGD